jgi:hypothetical protein
MKKLLVAAIVVLMASPAFAAIQNVKVSGDITTTFIDRSSFDLGLTGADEAAWLSGGSDLTGNKESIGLKKQNVFITQTRLRVDADLSDNVSTTVGLINERAWNSENGYYYTGTNQNPSNVNLSSDALDTNVQLYLASVTLREFLYSPLSVTIGRQVFSYGNGLVIGNGPGNQATGNLQFVAQDLTERTSEDGIKAVLDYKPLTIDLIYFKNNQLVLNGSVNAVQSHSDVYGYNANYQLGDAFNTVIEQYVFARFNKDQNQTGYVTPFTTLPTNGTDKGDTLYVPGLRASTNPIKGLNVQGELAWQLGTHPVALNSTSPTLEEAEHRNGMAAQFLASYSLPVLEKYKPTVNASYTYLSGDKDGNINYNVTPGAKIARTYSAWDPFTGAQAAGTIWQSLYPLTNLNILSAGASVSPLEDVTAAFTWTNLWAADSYSFNNPLAIYQPDGGTNLLYPITKKDRRGLGNEYDLNFTYNYTEDVTFGVSLGWYFTGSALQSTVDGFANKDAASQALANVAVKF